MCILSLLLSTYLCNIVLLIVFSDEDSPHSDEEYSYVNENHHKRNSIEEEDLYYITNDEILELRRNIKPRGNKSIKGSKSMEHLAF